MDNTTREVVFRDRETGEVRVERVFGEAGLRFLYERWIGRALTTFVLRHRTVSDLYGLLQRLPGSRRKIPDFVRSLGIDAAEAERALESYTSLDDFFTRRLKPGRRPVDMAPDHLVSPADGRALIVEGLGPGRDLVVKGSRVTLLELLGDDAALAERFSGGTAIVVRLAPADYHRFHFPESGTAAPATSLGRHLHSVHPIALAAGAPSFKNRRMLTALSTERFGELYLLEVGAMLVGGMVQTYRPGPVERGAEKGYFHFGGSTVVVLVGAGRFEPDEDLVEASAAGLETFVKMGTRLGRRPGS